MFPRPVTVNDLSLLPEIDGTAESTHYSHLNRAVDESSITWRLERRLLRDRLIDANRLTDDLAFNYKQIAAGIEDGLALCIEINDSPMASLVAQSRAEFRTLHLIDLRALTAETPTHNDPAIQLLRKLAFEPAGLDAFRFSNHDLVKEKATLLWCLPLN